MSESKPWDLWEVILEESDSKWVRWEDYARLKAEVEQARKISGEGMSVTLDLNNQLLAENARLKAEVERLTKAGDAMAEEFSFIGSPDGGFNSIERWLAAKEGKGQP
jgi:hypothetical protein